MDISVDLEDRKGEVEATSEVISEISSDKVDAFEISQKVNFAYKFAVDIGHENVRFFFYPSRRIISVPSYAATDGRKFFKGLEAKSIIGRHPSDMKVVTLLDNNTVKDYKILYVYLRDILSEVVNFRVPFTLLAGELYSLKKVDVKFLYKIFKQLGFWKVFFIPQPIATAVGLGLDITKPHGYLLLDIGAGTTKIGLVTLYGLSAYKEIEAAGRAMDKRIIDILYKEMSLSIGDRTAEELKKRALDLEYLYNPSKPEEYVMVKGIDSMSKLPTEKEVPKSLIVKAVEPVLYEIIEELKDLMGGISPELISDVLREGIYLTGGLSLTPNIEEYFSYKLNIKVNNTRTDKATIKGLGEILCSKTLFKKITTLREAKDLFHKIYVS